MYVCLYECKYAYVCMCAFVYRPYVYMCMYNCMYV